jgi:internalin A
LIGGTQALAIRGQDGVTGGIATTVGIALARSPSLDGLAIARERIAKEAEEKTGFLDLGNLGLTELPGELFRLGHLRRLNLGNGYRDEDGEWRNYSTKTGEKNSVQNDLCRLGELNGLQSLSLRNNVLSDLAWIEDLGNLIEIDCSFTQVRDLSPLAGLSHLQTVECSGTRVTDLSPLAGLSDLQTLDCTGTEVSNFTPVSTLGNLQRLYCS